MQRNDVRLFVAPGVVEPLQLGVAADKALVPGLGKVRSIDVLHYARFGMGAPRHSEQLG